MNLSCDPAVGHTAQQAESSHYAIVSINSARRELTGVSGGSKGSGIMRQAVHQVDTLGSE